MPADLRTRAIVLRRTNYGESDRILNFLTPEGKIAAVAHGVRKEKSRLAGAIELFSVADIVVHQGRGRLGTLTSAKMLKFYSHIVEDITRLELAAEFLKQIERAAEQADNPDLFGLLNQAFAGLDRGYPHTLVYTWFNFNFACTTGEEVNLICDINGEALAPDQAYSWDAREATLRPDPAGSIGTSEVKLARFLLSNSLALASRIQELELSLPPITNIAHSLNH